LPQRRRKEVIAAHPTSETRGKHPPLLLPKALLPNLEEETFMLKMMTTMRMTTRMMMTQLGLVEHGGSVVRKTLMMRQQVPTHLSQVTHQVSKTIHLDPFWEEEKILNLQDRNKKLKREGVGLPCPPKKRMLRHENERKCARENEKMSRLT
jgi:hypothetical protein